MRIMRVLSTTPLDAARLSVSASIDGGGPTTLGTKGAAAADIFGEIVTTCSVWMDFPLAAVDPSESSSLKVDRLLTSDSLDRARLCQAVVRAFEIFFCSCRRRRAC